MTKYTLMSGQDWFFEATQYILPELCRMFVVGDCEEDLRTKGLSLGCYPFEDLPLDELHLLCYEIASNLGTRGVITLHDAEKAMEAQYPGYFGGLKQQPWRWATVPVTPNPYLISVPSGWSFAPGIVPVTHSFTGLVGYGTASGSVQSPWAVEYTDSDVEWRSYKTPCIHEYINVSFSHIKNVCKKCDHEENA